LTWQLKRAYFFKNFSFQNIVCSRSFFVQEAVRSANFFKVRRAVISLLIAGLEIRQRERLISRRIRVLKAQHLIIYMLANGTGLTDTATVTINVTGMSGL
jgi:hypothetical protein